MNVYLAGPITGLTFDEARRWRLSAAARLEEYGITALDPLRGKEELGRTDRPLGAWFDGGSDAVTRDLTDIASSHIVLMNFEDCEVASLGTMAELGWAFAISSFDIEIVVVRNTDLYDHVFVDYMADKTFDNLGDALDYIISRRPIADPEGGRGIHGVELQDGTESYRGWLTGSDQAPGPVASDPVRPPEVDGGGAVYTARREKFDPHAHPRPGGW